MKRSAWSRNRKVECKICTKIILDTVAATLIAIIQDKVMPYCIVYSDYWRGHNFLGVFEFKHYRINHSKLFVNKKNHINGREIFYSQAKRHLRKFNGILKDFLHLFLKEYQWRFNKSKVQLRQLKQWVKDELNPLSGTASK